MTQLILASLGSFFVRRFTHRMVGEFVIKYNGRSLNTQERFKGIL